MCTCFKLKHRVGAQKASFCLLWKLPEVSEGSLSCDTNLLNTLLSSKLHETNSYQIISFFKSMHLLKPSCDPVSAAGHVGVTAGSNERPERSPHRRRAEWKVN